MLISPLNVNRNPRKPGCYFILWYHIKTVSYVIILVFTHIASELGESRYLLPITWNKATECPLYPSPFVLQFVHLLYTFYFIFLLIVRCGCTFNLNPDSVEIFPSILVTKTREAFLILKFSRPRLKRSNIYTFENDV